MYEYTLNSPVKLIQSSNSFCPFVKMASDDGHKSADNSAGKSLDAVRVVLKGLKCLL